jgi:hypothetical protein
VASVAILFGSVGIAQLGGAWITGGHATVAAGQRLGVDDIKGWMTLQQVSDGVGLPVVTIVGLIDPAGTAALTPQTALRDIEARVDGFDLPAFRERLRGVLDGAPAASGSAAGPGVGGTSPSPEASGR